MFKLIPQQASTFTSTISQRKYVPGLGRGAVGFVTKADVGPAGVQRTGAPPVGYVPGRGRGATGLADGSGDAPDPMKPGLGQPRGADAEDLEADQVYAGVDEATRRRKRKRGQDDEATGLSSRMGDSAKRSRATGAISIAEQHANAKQALATMSMADWESIPEESGARARSRDDRGSKKESFVPVPDSILLQGAGIAAQPPGQPSSAQEAPAGVSLGEASSGAGSSISSSSSSAATPAMPGLASSVSLGNARAKRLESTLAAAGAQVGGQSVIDPAGYASQLQTTMTRASSSVTDVDQTREVLRSLVATNSQQPMAWITAARFEASVGKTTAARKLILDGTKACPGSEDVWVEAASLLPADQAQGILAEAVRNVPDSVKVWLAAAELEATSAGKKAVLRAAIESIPGSVQLWKAAVGLEDEAEARLLLAAAVEQIPTAVDLWLALARIETYENARKVLNKARKANPTVPQIWITAAELEEAKGNAGNIGKVISMAVKSLSARGAMISRSKWLDHAKQAESASSPLTAAAIVRTTVGLGVEAADRLRTWLADAAQLELQGFVACSRACYATVLGSYPDQKNVWAQAVALERRYGTNEAATQLLQSAVQACPESQELWMLYAHHLRSTSDLDKARQVLAEAIRANPSSSVLWLAASSLEKSAEHPDRAEALLRRAQSAAPSIDVWVKLARLLRSQGRSTDAEASLKEGLAKFPKSPELRVLLGRLRDAHTQGLLAAGKAGAEVRAAADAAMQIYKRAIRACPHAPAVWLGAARLLEQPVSQGGLGGGAAKARSLLESGRQRQPGLEELWVEGVRLEARHGQEKAGDALLAKGLKAVPKSGLLWAERISRTPRAQQRGVAVQAARSLDRNSIVIVRVAALLWRERSYDKARRWFSRAVAIDGKYGDGWAYWMAFESDQGTEESRRKVVEQCEDARPTSGELWEQVSEMPEFYDASVASKLARASKLAAARHAESAASQTGAVASASAFSSSSGAAAGGGGGETDVGPSTSMES